jgi:hypothetical protein
VTEEKKKKGAPRVAEQVVQMHQRLFNTDPQETRKLPSRQLLSDLETLALTAKVKNKSQFDEAVEANETLMGKISVTQVVIQTAVDRLTEEVLARSPLLFSKGDADNEVRLIGLVESLVTELERSEVIVTALSVFAAGSQKYHKGLREEEEDSE